MGPDNAAISTRDEDSQAALHVLVIEDDEAISK